MTGFPFPGIGGFLGLLVGVLGPSHFPLGVCPMILNCSSYIYRMNLSNIYKVVTQTSLSLTPETNGHIRQIST